MTYLPSASSWKTALATICFVFLLGTSAWSQNNLLANPGFETGDFTGWTVTADSLNYGVNTNGFVINGTDPDFGVTTVVVHTGNYAGYTLVCDTWCGGPPYGMYVGLSQTLNLLVGEVYTVSFWIGNGSIKSYGDSSEVLVNGQPILLTTDPVINPGYQMVSCTFIATQPSNTITFIITGSGTGIAGFSFDDFSLVDSGPAPSNGGYALMVDQNNNQISSYEINSYTGAFTPGSGSPFGAGSSPVAVAAVGRLVYVADQGSSQISAYTINFNTGQMVQVPGSPYSAGIAPGAVAMDSSLHLLYASGVDSNGNGAIAGWYYAPAIGTLTPVSGSPFPAGTAPGAIAFDRTGRYAYVVDKANNQLLAYGIDTGSGALTPLPGSPYTTGASPSAVATDYMGGYLYVTNSGDQSITGYQIGSGGALSGIAGSPFPTGTTPVSLKVNRGQRYLYVANSGSNNIWAYQINAGTGALSPVSGSPFSSGPQPQTIVTSGPWIYTNTTAGVSAYQVNGSTGALTEVPGSPLQYFGTALGTNGVTAASTP